MEKSTSCYLEREKQKVTMGQVLTNLTSAGEIKGDKASPSRFAELREGRGRVVGVTWEILSKGKLLLPDIWRWGLYEVIGDVPGKASVREGQRG